jgi:hypothetical protein
MQSWLLLSRLVFSTRHPLSFIVHLIKTLSETFQSMEHWWIARYWKADFSPLCSSACSIQQWKPSTYIFSNGWVIYHWIRNLQDFSIALHIWNRKWRWWNFCYLVWCAWLIDGWSILCAKPKDRHLKTPGVIHKRHIHTQHTCIHTYRSGHSNFTDSYMSESV